MNSQNKNKLILGITGSFGSGKTTVAQIFKSSGAHVLDADKLAHDCLIPGTLSYKRIIKVFGKGILKQDKTIDRKKLAAIVFNNKNLLLKLNRIIHPAVIRIIKDKINSSGSKLIVLDVPLLLESGLKKQADKLIVVKITKQKQIERIRKRDALGLRDILNRISNQIPLKQKAKLADFIIDNSGTLKETRKQVKNIWKSIFKTR